MATDPLAHVRMQIALRLAEIRHAGRRLSPLDLHAKMEAIRQLAVEHGLAALEDVARCSAQRALLPGHRVTMMSCLEHLTEALDIQSEQDRTAVLAALAVRLN